jgi:hypothetical protein
MTAKEFREWYAAHRSAFASIDSWIASMPKKSELLAVGGESFQPVTQESLAKAWFDVLADMDLAGCLAATKMLHRGDEPQPKAFDLHPQTVRGIAKRLAREKQDDKSVFRFGPRIRANGEETVNCRECLDSGYVFIFHPDAMRLIRDGKTYGDPGTRYTALALCSCDCGQRRKKQRVAERMDEFDPARHVRIECGRSHPSAEDIQRLHDFIANERPANYEPALENW